MDENLEKMLEEALDTERVRRATSVHRSAADMPQVLMQEFVRLPADLAYYNAVYSETLRLVLHAKKARDVREATLTIDFKKGDPPEGLRSMSESVVVALIEQDLTFIALQDDVIAAEVLRSRLGGIVEAIKAKRESLTSLGMLMQAELRSLGMESGIRKSPREAEAAAGISPPNHEHKRPIGDDQ